MKNFDVQSIRKQFPFFLTQENSEPQIIYFDNAATTQKPSVVIDAIAQYYRTENANVHRSSHRLSARATQKFELARARICQFINASSEREIVWTKGTTEGINLIATCWGKTNISEGDEIVISHGEHHANIVPWQILAQQTGAKLVVLPLDESGCIDQAELARYINANTKLVAINWISNVLGKLNPVKEIIACAKSHGALTLVDAAQVVAHYPVDVQALDCDFLVFSGHKMYGPTGTGVLYAKEAHLQVMPPYQYGGEMINKVSFSGTTFADLPFKFETGTPNIAGVIGLSEAVSFCQSIHSQGASEYENTLLTYTYQKLSQIKQIQFLTHKAPDIPVFSFTIEGHNIKDFAAFADSKGIALRAGHHCAMPLMEYLNIDGCIRVSVAPYNTFEEIDHFISVIHGFLNDEQAGNDAELSVSNNINIGQQAAQQAIVERITRAKGWDGRHREIMLLSKELERMPKSYRDQHSIIEGCESAAWLMAEKNTHQVWHFMADSDAKIIRGLLVIVLSVYQNKSAQQILDFDVDAYFTDLGLMEHLSPSRGNGLKAIVDKIKALVSI